MQMHRRAGTRGIGGRDVRGARRAATQVGAILGDNFYYAKEPGEGGDRSVHWVEGVGGAPVFHATPAFAVGEDLFTASVLDFVPQGAGCRRVDRRRRGGPREHDAGP